MPAVEEPVNCIGRPTVLQDHGLARLQRRVEEARFPYDGSGDDLDAAATRQAGPTPKLQRRAEDVQEPCPWRVSTLNRRSPGLFGVALRQTSGVESLLRLVGPDRAVPTSAPGAPPAASHATKLSERRHIVRTLATVERIPPPEPRRDEDAMLLGKAWTNRSSAGLPSPSPSYAI